MDFIEILNLTNIKDVLLFLLVFQFLDILTGIIKTVLTKENFYEWDDVLKSRTFISGILRKNVTFLFVIAFVVITKLVKIDGLDYTLVVPFFAYELLSLTENIKEILKGNNK